MGEGDSAALVILGVARLMDGWCLLWRCHTEVCLSEYKIYYIDLCRMTSGLENFAIFYYYLIKRRNQKYGTNDKRDSFSPRNFRTWEKREPGR